jgi:phosphoribosylformylglycinamidine (FGAM) synthase PurS component
MPLSAEKTGKVLEIELEAVDEVMPDVIKLFEVMLFNAY